MRIDIENWNRRDHFHFYKGFEEPFFGLSVNVDCSFAFKQAKNNGHSFFLLYLHKVLLAVNETEAFRYRIEIEDHQKFVRVHNLIHAGATINRPDGTFGFSRILFRKDFDDFSQLAEKEIHRVRNSSGLEPDSHGDIIHFTVVPWLQFTSLAHARNFSHHDSCPKIAIGKMFEQESKYLFPVSVHVHHALADARDIAGFLEKFEGYLQAR